MFQKCLAFLISVLLLTACNTTSKSDPNLSFYYWKMEGTDTGSLSESIEVERMYIHIADIYWDEQRAAPMPKAKSRIGRENRLFDYATTPVIFIDQKIFSEICLDSIAGFATRILTMHREFVTFFERSDADVRTLQIDCDWLESNKDKYFRFLTELKNQSPDLLLSVTIRLYPYKYYKRMGVPPADYGVLMCYNMDIISEPSTLNSIIDTDVLASYLSSKKYPLPLKPALPIFGWYAWFKPDGFQRIVYLPKDWIDGDLTIKLQDNKYQLQKDTVVQGFYLRNGDILRNEFPTKQTLDESLSLIKKYLNPDEIVFYHWDETLLNYYEEFIKSNW